MNIQYCESCFTILLTKSLDQCNIKENYILRKEYSNFFTKSLIVKMFICNIFQNNFEILIFF